MKCARDESLIIPPELLAALGEGSHERTLVVGIGSPHGEDMIGWRIADLIAQLGLPGVTVRRAQLPLDLLDWLECYSVTHIIDAMQSSTGDEAVVRCWQWPNVQGLVSSASTSHNFDIVSVLRLAGVLGKDRANIFIWGVMPASNDASIRASNSQATESE